MPDDIDSVFADHVKATLGALLEYQPEWATEVGDHSHDGRLTVGTAGHYAEVHRWAGQRAAALAAFDLGCLSPQNRVDAQMLANHLARLRFTTGTLCEHVWNPALASPGQALAMLLARDFAPLPDRLRSAAGRLACLPASLAAARSVAGAMPQTHIEFARGRFVGTQHLIEERLLPLAQDTGGPGQELIAAAPAALNAIGEQLRWLDQQLADGVRDGFRDPRLGADLYARKLALALDTDLSAEDLLARAEADLLRAREEIAAAAAEFTGAKAGGDDLVNRALDDMAADALDESTIFAAARAALTGLRKFVETHDPVTVLSEPVEVIEMPEIDRGGPMAYCDGPGPLETLPLPTFIAVSPPPETWPPARINSYWRENNQHLLHLLMIHEGIPGHAAQFAHSRRFTGTTPVRAVLWSRPFTEGWAVYAEQLMCAYGYPGEGNPVALLLQRLKAGIRAITNAIVDVRVHCLGMTEAEARAVTVGRGYQEDSSAAIQWRRALLNAASLPTYYVGFAEVSSLAAGLRAANPTWPDRRLHDAMLAHGSPPVRHLRALLAVPQHGGPGATAAGG